MDLADDLIQKGVLKTPRIISAFRAIHRADFMPESDQSLANIDEAFPIGERQTISQPYTVACMLELLQAEPGHTVMDVGSGSGWQTALLAHIVTDNKRVGGRVFALERLPALCAFGKANIEKYNFITSGVVEVFCRNAVTGLAEIAARIGGFDRIIAAAALRVPGTMQGVEMLISQIPPAWRQYIKIEGRIVLPINESIWVFTKRSDGSFTGIEYPGFVFVPLL